MAEPNATGNGIITYVRKNPRVRKLLIIGGIALPVVILVMWWYYSGRETTDDAQIDGHIVPVSSHIAGAIETVLVEENTYVKRGSEMVRIDPRDYQVALERARGELAQAEAQAAAAYNEVIVSSASTRSGLTTARANVSASEASIAAAEADVGAARARADSAEARVRAAQANSDKAARDLDRVRPLLAKEEVAQRDFDALSAAAEAAQAELDSARAVAAEAEQQVSNAESRLAQIRQHLTQSRAGLTVADTAPQQQAAKEAQAKSADALVRQKKAALDQAKLNLEYAVIRAPVDGWVSKRVAEPGQMIQPGQPLFSLVPLQDIWVTANFKETQLKNMRVDQPARVSVDAYDRTFEGHVVSISPATGAKLSLLPPENATGNYVKVVQRVPVRIALNGGQDPKHFLRPGMSVIATVKTR